MRTTSHHGDTEAQRNLSSLAGLSSPWLCVSVVNDCYREGDLNPKRENYSLLIKGGRLIDPAAKIDATMDVLLRDGQVVEVAPPGKTRGDCAREIRRARVDRRSRLHRSACSLARARDRVTRKPSRPALPLLLPEDSLPSAACPTRSLWSIRRSGSPGCNGRSAARW